MEEISQEERNKARKRWKLLAQVLRGGDCSSASDSTVSVRRFQAYGLLPVKSIKSKTDDGESWFSYKCKDIPEFSMSIRHLRSTVSVETLNGFNNTGNVCVWPSEEVLTYYCMKHFEMFKGQRICELGGGMTCLAGVSLAIYSGASHVELTDGNEDSVQNLEEIIKNNPFTDTTVGCRVLRWGCGSTDEDLLGSFDTIICADCFFFDEGRTDLASLVFDLLKPGGQALMFAPSRNETFQKFAEIAATLFTVEKMDNYDDYVWSLHCRLMEDKKETYDVSLHFPKMMKLYKPSSSTREITPESR